LTDSVPRLARSALPPVSLVQRDRPARNALREIIALDRSITSGDARASAASLEGLTKRLGVPSGRVNPSQPGGGTYVDDRYRWRYTPGAGYDLMLKAFVFDAYGTLFDVYAVTALCEELFPGSGASLAVLCRAKQLQYSLLRSLMNRYENFWRLTQDSLDHAARRLTLDLTAEKRALLMNAYRTLPTFPDVKPGLEQLQALGARLAILSNGEPKMLAAAVESAGLSHLLDAVISVDEIKTFKPSPRVYALIKAHVPVSAAETCFVSANDWDVNGAGAAGLTAFWIQRTAEEASDELGYPAARVVRAVTDLCALVRG
jgi:2-haloacid dehalogenase